MPITPGRQYHLDATVTVLSAAEGTVTIAVEGHGTFTLTRVGGADLEDLGDWTDIEPAYEPGALYRAADDKVWKRHEPVGSGQTMLSWSAPEFDEPTVYDHTPVRDLTRLYPAGEAPE